MSSPTDTYHKPFFASSSRWPKYLQLDMQYDGPELYAPESFEQAARDLAQCCSSLQMIRMQAFLGYRDDPSDLACQVIRDGDTGNVTDIDTQRNGWMTIGREEEW